jgi:hypothetical protein
LGARQPPASALRSSLEENAMQENEPITSVGWTTRFMRWEFLAVILVIVAVVTIGIVTTIRHGERPQGGINADGQPVPAHADGATR